MKELSEEVYGCFRTLNELMEKSFALISQHEDVEDEVCELWKKSIRKFVNHSYKMSEKYDNKEVVKAITKGLMFGR